MRPIKLALALVTAGALAGCASTFSRLPWVGEPEGIPDPPAQAAPYPAVHDIPPARDTKPLTEAERKKLEEDLVATRERQEALGRGAAPKNPVKKKETRQAPQTANP